MIRLALILAPLLLLAACSTLSEDQCRQGDWFQVGRDDGAGGRKPDFIAQHSKACQPFGIAPDAAAWTKGREEGLRLYCTPQRAFREGAGGKHLSTVCPAKDLARLERANAQGFRLYWIDQEISETRRDINDLESDLARLPANDPARSRIISEISFLRLDLLSLRAERARYRRY